jgi:hypothetical protein
VPRPPGPRTKKRRSHAPGPPRRRPSWTHFSEEARRSPKLVLEEDLRFALAGLVVVFFGSLITAGGYYWTGGRYSSGSSVYQQPPEPILGVIVFFIGVALIGVGVIGAILCAGIYLRARMERSRAPDDPM